MALPGDHHVHTRFSDGEAEPAECVERALELGLPAIGFADHLAPSCLRADGDWSITHDRLDEYVGAIRDAAARYPQIDVLLSVEVDYLPGSESELAGTLAAYPFDYVLGAVHYVDGFSFDDPPNRDDARWSDPDAALYRRYYALVREALATGLFDVVAHLDYIGLWGHTLPADISDAEDETLAAVAAAGAALEVNTTGALDPAGRMYPAPGLLRRACRLGIPVVFASDAHTAGDVGWAFDRGVDLARDAGYTSCLEPSTGARLPLA